MRNKRAITAKERDEIVAQLQHLMTRWRISPNTVGKFAEIASKEALG